MSQVNRVRPEQLVERLRLVSHANAATADYLRQASDQIEQLQRDRDVLAQACINVYNQQKLICPTSVTTAATIARNAIRDVTGEDLD